MRKIVLIPLLGIFAVLISTRSYSQVANKENINDSTIKTTNLNEIRVLGSREGNYLSKTKPLKTEVITNAGLCKMACCNLSESFENSASVSVSYADAVTGAKQIKLLGLSGTYTQMLDENRPILRAISSPFGLSFVPGQWLESIQISKGASSVTNGLEGITGLINLEHRKPTDEKPLFVNLFIGDQKREEVNLSSSLQLNDKLSTIILFHAAADNSGSDMNEDGFRDEPLKKSYIVSNRWLYIANSGVQVRFGYKLIWDNRVGGQIGYDPKAEQSLDIWGSKIINKGSDIFLKLGIPLNSDNSRNLALVSSYDFYDLNSTFGMKSYKGKQNSLMFNLIYQDESLQKSKFVFGLSGVRDLFDEKLVDFFYKNGSYNSPHYDLGRSENNFALYGEHTYKSDQDKLTVVSGVRFEHNNLFGNIFAPRFNVKYSFTPKLVFRGTAGRGVRSSNLISDNFGVLSTSREIVFDLNKAREDAWTYGLSFTSYFKAGYGENSYLSVEYFYTNFNKQVVADQEFIQNTVKFYMVNGNSFAKTVQVDLSLEPVQRFTINTTFKYVDSKILLESQGYVDRALNSKYKGVINLQYATKMNKWTLDFTTQFNGPARLPAFLGYNKHSPSYTMLYAQVTRRLKDLDVYIGGENLTNFKQSYPIVGYQDPYSNSFNASAVWGPIMGIRFYGGIRFTLWK